MKLSVAFSALLAASFVYSHQSFGGVVNFDVTKKYLQRSSKTSSKSEEVSLVYDYVGYYASVSIGTPAQDILVHIDTGSSDLWVDGTDNFECNKTKKKSSRRKRDETSDYSSVYEAYELALNLSDYCLGTNIFNKSSSSTWKANGTNLSITYEDGSFAKGYWGTDVVNLGNFTLRNFSIGVADNSTAGAVLGIGYTNLESTYLYGGNKEKFQYLNFPARLKADGLISKVTYSLYMSGSNSLGGQLLFGGIDHAKYTGKLLTVPVISKDRFVVTLNNFTYQSNETIQLFNKSVPAMLDSGTTVIGLPENLIKEFLENLRGERSKNWNQTLDGTDLYEVECDRLTGNSTFNFDFGGQTIKVNSSSLISINGDYCYANIASLGNVSYIILGDTFLTSSYLVYDLEDAQIAIAQASYSDDQDIEPIISTIPSAKTAPAYSSTVSFSEIDQPGTTITIYKSASTTVTKSASTTITKSASTKITKSASDKTSSHSTAKSSSTTTLSSSSKSQSKSSPTSSTKSLSNSKSQLKSETTSSIKSKSTSQTSSSKSQSKSRSQT